MLDDVVKGAVEGLVRGILSGRTSGRVVEAEHFVLRDGAKDVRAMLTMLPEGPGLVLLDANQEAQGLLAIDDRDDAVYLQLNCIHDPRRKVVMRTDKEGPQVFLHDRNENVQARLLGEADAVSLELSGEDEHTKVVLRVDPGEPQLFFRDRRSQHRAVLMLTAAGPVLEFFDAEQRCRAHLSVDSAGTPQLVVFNEAGEVWGEFPAKEP